MIDLTAFQNWLKLNTSSENTALSYYYCIRSFFNFSQGEINNELIQKYFLHLIESKKSNSTFNQTVQAFKVYSQFTKTEYDIPKTKRIDERLIEDYITEEELNYIISYLPKIFQDPFHVELILKFLFYTGLRKGELFNLTRNDINLEKNIITIRNTKSNRDERIYFPKSLVPMIRAYYLQCPEKDNAFNVYKHTLIYWFEQLNTQLIFRIHLHPHTLRHSACTYFFTIEKDYRRIQKQMRHTDIKITMKYSHLSEEELGDWYNKKIR